MIHIRYLLGLSSAPHIQRERRENERHYDSGPSNSNLYQRSQEDSSSSEESDQDSEHVKWKVKFTDRAK